VKATSRIATTLSRSGLARNLRRAVATRDASLRAKGSGAPRCASFAVQLFAICAFGLLVFAPASEAKVVVGAFGTPGDHGGQFGTARGIAVNSSGVGAPVGTIYVVDSQNRVQRFSSAGTFQRAWGENVIGRSERQQITFTGNFPQEPSTSLGSFTLGFGGETTSPIAVTTNSSGFLESPNTTSIRNALTALPSIGANNVTVSGSTFSGFTVTFVGALAGTDVSQLVADGGGITTTALSVSASTLENGAGGTAGGFEICTTASLCQAGEETATTANGGQLNNPEGIAVDQATGNVYVTEAGNRRISEFDASGNFIRAWGWDVVKTGGAGDVSTNAFEICTVITDCKRGLSGENGGEFGNEIGSLAFDSSNNLWVADPANRRIQEFSASGSFIAAYGYNVDPVGGGGALEKCEGTAVGACRAGQEPNEGVNPGEFGNSNPTDLAFDSAGNLYANDYIFLQPPSLTPHVRIEKFNPALTSVSDFGTSLFAEYTSKTARRILATQGGTRLNFSVQNNLHGGGETQILEVDPTNLSSVKDTSLVGLGLGAFGVSGGEPEGMAVNTATGNIYLTAPFGRPRSVLELGSTPPPAPAVSIDQVTTKTDTTATLSGHINPGQGLVDKCKFEYSLDQIEWTSVAEPDCSAMEANSGVHAVSENVTGLQPNTQYFVRFTASRGLVANSAVSTAIAAFTTDAPPPAISDVGAVDITNTSARLVGTIDPKHSATAYVFEYGLTPSLGSSTAPLAIGGGAQPITVSQVVTGLTPNTTYYLKVVATNLTGSTASPSTNFLTRVSAPPPGESRKYEMVTPPNKNFGEPANAIGFFGAEKVGYADTGNAVGFCTSTLFGEPPGRNFAFCAQYISRRTPNGWTTSSPFPNTCKYDPGANNPAGDLYSEGFIDVHVAPDYSHFVVKLNETERCSIPQLDPNAPLVPGGVSYNLYQQNQSSGEPFEYHLLNPHVGGDTEEMQEVIGGSEDFSHVIYESEKYNQTDPPDSPAPGNFRKLYDWEEQGSGTCVVPGGCLTLLSKKPDNQPFTTPSGISSRLGEPPGSAVSEDGRRIYFQNPQSGSTCNSPGCELYMRQNGDEPPSPQDVNGNCLDPELACTFDVSKSECTLGGGVCGNDALKADTFITATPSGNVAFFASCAKLTDASSPPGGCEEGFSNFSIGNPGSKLYRWDMNAPPGHGLTDLTADHELVDGGQPNFRGFIGASADGDTAFFVATGQIVGGASTQAGEKLYRWRWNNGSPTIDYIGPYQAVVGGGAYGNSESNFLEQPRQVTPNGEYLVLYSKLRLNPAADSDSSLDLYRWDETQGWTCISCQAPNMPSTGDVNNMFPLWLHGVGFNGMESSMPIRIMSNDGQHIFFATPDALVPEDVNGEAGCPMVQQIFVKEPSCQDIYEWNDGTISLVSTGTGSEPVRLMGATPDGKNVFFLTRQHLVGWDVDDNMDVYDARVGGGFPEPPPQPPSCEGEACRNAGSVPTSIPGAGTAVFEGPQNEPRSLDCRHGRVKRNGKCVKKPHKKRHSKRTHHRATNDNRRASR
jgi:hypothetical protein